MIEKKFSFRISQYFELCAQVAQKSPMEWKYGCVIVRKGRIISQGYNHYRLTPFSGPMTTHAEIDALNKLKNKNLLNNATMYIIRINNKISGPKKNYSILSGKPCHDCIVKLTKLIKRFGLKKIIYSTDSYILL